MGLVCLHSERCPRSTVDAPRYLQETSVLFLAAEGVASS
jgi:hypothetical protein